MNCIAALNNPIGNMTQDKILWPFPIKIESIDKTLPPIIDISKPTYKELAKQVGDALV